MFDRMHYLFTEPEDIEGQAISIRSTVRFLLKFEKVLEIRDSDGRLLGNLREDLSNSTNIFEDTFGNKLGEIKIVGRAKGESGYKLSILNSLNIPRGIITGGANKYLSIVSRKTTVVPIHKLEDTSGHLIAITDSFQYRSAWTKQETISSTIRMNGMNVRDPNGNIIATCKAGPTTDSFQIDLLSSSIDGLLVLSLIISVIRGLLTPAGG